MKAPLGKFETSGKAQELLKILKDVHKGCDYKSCKEKLVLLTFFPAVDFILEHVSLFLFFFFFNNTNSTHSG